MNTSAQTDHRALLHVVGHRKVRAVANEIGQYAEALYAVIADRKPRGVGWPREEWEALLEELDKSTMTVAEFLAAEHVRPKA